MSLTLLRFQVTEADSNQRLDQFLSLKMPLAAKREISRAQVRGLIVAGAVYLNHHRVRVASKPLIPGAIVEVRLNLALLKDKAALYPKVQFSPNWILFEDQHLLILNKPPQLPSQPTVDNARDNLFGLAKKFLSEREGVPDAYLGLHHRLDRDTTGVILLTKTREVNAEISRQFQEREITKTYLAISEVQPGRKAPQAGDDWVIQNYLGEIPKTRPRQWGQVTSGGDYAETHVLVLATQAQGQTTKCLLRARPKTGRTHQIRIHLADQGLPILGEVLYAPKVISQQAPRVLLHAGTLELKHPISKENLVVSAPYPKDFVDKMSQLKLRYAP